MCFTVQLSRFLSVFDSFDILSYRFELVKNFFNFFQNFLIKCFEISSFLKTNVSSSCCHFFLATAIIDYHIFRCLSTTFSNFFEVVNHLSQRQL